jgi:hypothetical protein
LIAKAAAPKSGWYHIMIPTTFFADVELKNAIRRTMKELMCTPACGAIVWGFVIETAEIGSIASQFAVAYCIRFRFMLPC